MLGTTLGPSVERITQSLEKGSDPRRNLATGLKF
jgi:hypothetical protein